MIDKNQTLMAHRALQATNVTKNVLKFDFEPNSKLPMNNLYNDK